MALSRKIPGEGLSVRLGARLFRASGLLMVQRLGRRLAERSLGMRASRRWERSAMLARLHALQRGARRSLSATGLEPVFPAPIEVALPEGDAGQGAAPWGLPSSSGSLRSQPVAWSRAFERERSSPLRSRWAERQARGAPQTRGAPQVRGAQREGALIGPRSLGRRPAPVGFMPGVRRRAREAAGQAGVGQSLGSASWAASTLVHEPPPALGTPPAEAEGLPGSALPLGAPLEPPAPPPRGAATPLEAIDARFEAPVGLISPSPELGWGAGLPGTRGLDAMRGARLAGERSAPRHDQEASVSPSDSAQPHPSRGVLNALARAGAPDQVVRIFADRSEEIQADSRLPGPLRDLVRQIRNEAERWSSKEEPAPKALAMGRPRKPGAAGGRSASAPLQRSMPVPSENMMNLVRRLQRLIHLAETDRRLLEARRRVRMAEDEASARAEGSGASGGEGPGSAGGVDIASVGRDVLYCLTQELETRQYRRLEDDDVRCIRW